MSAEEAMGCPLSHVKGNCSQELSLEEIKMLHVRLSCLCQEMLSTLLKSSVF